MKSFHAFRLDTVNHCLWCGEQRLTLAPKAFDVLRYLMEHADRLVTQDEILEALWPGTYVNPEIVKKYILGIRKALGDQSDKPTFVATFPRRGYQFIAPVRDETPPISSAPVMIEKKIVGRERALAQLHDAFEKALQGQRQIIFITGEAGIGKSTLVDVFLQSSTLGKNPRIARGHCVEGFGGKEAYYPILDALGQLFRNASDGRALQAFSKQAPTWLVQFPSLVNAEQRQTLEKEIIGATRERMVREICETLETITALQPLVLFLEDLHWVDPSTLDFISALSRRRGPARLLVLGSYRPADVIISQSPLKALKQDLVIHKLSREIALERLEKSDVAEYLAIEFPRGGFPDGFADMIYRHSGGNALFMVTVLQNMVEKGLIERDNEIWKLTVPLEDMPLSVPETLDQLIDAQFQQLTPVEQRILRSASVAGEHFSVWGIATAVQLDSETIEEACQTLADSQQFITFAGIHELANGQISTHYEFRHSLYREVVYRRLSQLNRSKLHLLLAQRLKAFCDPCEQELATELAMHFEEGNDYQQAIRYLMLASENAVGRFAYRDSIEILHHALELAAKLDSNLRPELEVRILISIGSVHFALGALPESAETYETAALRAREAGLPARQVDALICAIYPLGFIDPDRGLRAMSEAERMSMKTGDPLLSSRTQMLAAGCRLVFDAWSKEDAELCRAAHQNMRLLDAESGNPYEQMVYAHVLTLEGCYREALEIFEAVLARTDRGVNLTPHFGALSGKILVLLRLGQFGEVLKITRSGRQSPDQNLARSWLLGLREAWLRMLVFDYDGAVRICESIVESAGDLHPGQPETIGEIAAGYMALERTQYKVAIEHFNRVYEPDVTVKFFAHWIWRMMAHLELGNAWLLLGDIPKAQQVSDDFLESSLSAADPHLQALGWELKTRVAMAENDLQAAEEYIEQAIQIAEKFEILVAAWQSYATAQQLYLRMKNHKTAELNRKRAETCIFKIADSFPPEEPLRAIFLAAAPVRPLLSQRIINKGARNRESSRSATS